MTQARLTPKRRCDIRFVSALVGAAILAFPATAQDPSQHFLRYNQPMTLPEIRFEDGQGRAVTLANFKGKVVLLNIWATWCAPCRREMPTLDRLQVRLGGPDFEVVALSIDRQGIKIVEQFYKELKINHLAMYIDTSGKIGRDLNVRGLPTSLLIDRSGRELAWMIGPADWDSPASIAFIRPYLSKQTDNDSAAPRLAAPSAPVEQRTGYVTGRHKSSERRETGIMAVK
jgi:thiol-disulfide isomerase/thioredoxin